ncbi:TPA: hypothetical protein JLG68_001364 [Escherichia coli]|nr:hypothetical protein [Escherichia coli]
MIELFLPRGLYPLLVEEANKRKVSVKKLIVLTLLERFGKEDTSKQ